MPFLGRFFKVYSIMTEKQRLKPKKLSSLSIFASFDTPLDPRRAKVMECNDLGGIYSSVYRVIQYLICMFSLVVIWSQEG